MKFSENWLREWVDPEVSRDELCLRLDMIGLEVESVEVLGAELDGVVVGEIVAAEPHPDADRLRVCQVETGAGALVQIVCGAPNARVGLKAPLATVGATLPNGLAIKATTLRGIESSGMLCSARELGLDTDAAGLMELPADAQPGMALAQLLGLPDAAIELGLTPNRADCLGLLGLASDIAAVYDTPVRDPGAAPVAAQSTLARGVHLEAPGDCPRYLGRVVEGTDAGAATPAWMAERLRRSGIRPISIAVDITAYVMLELGQPMHAFDLDRLQGDIVVRRAREGEALTLLDGRELSLTPDYLVIADQSRAVALAGIMGGQDSRVVADSRNVLLEAAHFAPAALAGRARRLGLHTDASHRFERGVDPALPRRAIERATALLVEIAGGRPGPVVEAVDEQHLPARAPVLLRRQRIERVLGLAIDDAEVVRILTALAMHVQATDQGWLATPPGRRFDIAIEEDLIEEVARIHGYEHIPTRPPAGELSPTLPSEDRLGDGQLRRSLAARGWQEALCFAFVDPDLLQRWHLDAGVVALANPLSADLAAMRPSLLPGLVQALAYNRARQQERLRLFELGRSFKRGATGPVEHDCLALAACGPAEEEHWDRSGQPPRPMDFHDLKGELERLTALTGAPSRWRFQAVADVPWLHPGRSATILRDGHPMGWAGALHPALLKALDLDTETWVAEVDLQALRQARVPAAVPVSRFPQIRRDIAVVVAETVPYGELESAIREVLKSDLDHIIAFDEYRGPGLSDGVKSVAIGLILRNPSRTLTDEDADRAVARAVGELKERFDAVLRG